MSRIFLATTALLWMAATLSADSALSPQAGVESGPLTNGITASFWNIQWFPGRRPNASRGEEERQIRSVHRDITQLTSDVIGFEEVRDFEHAGLAVQPLKGFKVDVCSNFPSREDQTVAQQVAITSRLQPMSAWAESWKAGRAITPPRGFAFAAYQIAPGKMLLVYAVHLKSNRGEIHEDMRIREESMHQLLAHMNSMVAAYGKLGTIAWIVGGDFNTTPDDARFAGERTLPDLMARGFNWSWQGMPLTSRITMPPDARFPAACFDQIFFRGAMLTKAWVERTSPQSSDHRAVNLSVTLPDTGKLR